MKSTLRTQTHTQNQICSFKNTNKQKNEEKIKYVWTSPNTVLNKTKKQKQKSRNISIKKRVQNFEIVINYNAIAI